MNGEEAAAFLIRYRFRFAQLRARNQLERPSGRNLYPPGFELLLEGCLDLLLPVGWSRYPDLEADRHPGFDPPNVFGLQSPGDSLRTVVGKRLGNQREVVALAAQTPELAVYTAGNASSLIIPENRVFLQVDQISTTDENVIL